MDGLSCLYIDWANIGTWVGGVGSAAAAIVAIWSSKSETRRRAKYAAFLFRRDVERLTQIEDLLRKSADAMHERGIFGHHQHPDEDELKSDEDAGFRALHSLASQLEYFGRSERLFEYNPGNREFADLEAAVNAILGIPEAVDRAFARSNRVVASDAMSHLLNQLSAALKPFLEQTRGTASVGN